MKVAIWYNLPSGGAKRALYYHVKGLVARGYTVEAWCPPTADQEYLPLAGLIRQHIIPLDMKHTSRKNLIGKVWAASIDMLDNIKAFHAHCALCAEAINNGGFDLFYGTSSSYMAVSPIGRYVNIPKLLYLQEPTRWLYEAMPVLPWVARDFSLNPLQLPKYLENLFRVHCQRIFLREELRNIQAYDSILANSFYSRESILRAYGVNSTVCYLGIDTTMFTDNRCQRENFVIGVGSFNEPKNIKFIIKALAKVTQPRPPLVWVGNYAIPSSYLDELRELALSLDVDFIPMKDIADSELVNVLNRAAMFVYAPRLEPFGFVPLEANACGLPVIAVAEGGVRETVVDGSTGLLVEPDEAAMAKAIERLRDDNEYARTLGENARKIVFSKWSLDASIDRIESIIKKVAGH